MFQVAAHEDLIPPEELYRICRIGYEIACLQYGVCRVIARPFVGTTPRRLQAHAEPARLPGAAAAARRCSTAWPRAGWPVFGVGKIEDIFTGRGISGAVHTTSDADGIDQTLKAMDGVRIAASSSRTSWTSTRSTAIATTSPGYAANLEPLDARLPEVLGALREDDVFILTADHGCDPVRRLHRPHPRARAAPGPRAAGAGRGGTWASVRRFADLGATLAENFGVGRRWPPGRRSSA